MNLAQRSPQKELLDRTDIPFDDIRRNMQELDFINTYLGGHKITLDGIKELMKNDLARRGTAVTVCEIGCGGGDNLLAIEKWCRKKNIPVRFVGIDINPFCIEVARTKLAGQSPTLVCADYKDVSFEESRPDIIFSSLFCHHFTNSELVGMLGWMNKNSRKGFFINDLHRNAIAYHSIRLLTTVFSSSYLVKNDAPLSVLRGFTRREWLRLLDSAAIRSYSIRWKWAFRHLVVVSNALTR